MRLNGGWGINIVTFNRGDWVVDFCGGGAKDRDGRKYTTNSYRKSDFILLLKSVSRRVVTTKKIS